MVRLIQNYLTYPSYESLINSKTIKELKGGGSVMNVAFCKQLTLLSKCLFLVGHRFLI